MRVCNARRKERCSSQDVTSLVARVTPLAPLSTPVFHECEADAACICRQRVQRGTSIQLDEGFSEARGYLAKVTAALTARARNTIYVQSPHAEDSFLVPPMMQRYILSRIKKYFACSRGQTMISQAINIIRFIILNILTIFLNFIF